MRVLSKIQQRIVDLVQINWATVTRPLLLAPLGGLLRREFPDEFHTELAGRKLKDYLQTELGQSLQLIQNPSKPIEWGLVPKEVTAASFDATAANVQSDSLVPDHSHRVFSPTTSIQYKFELWNAFAWPISPGVNRFIRLDGGIQVQERPEDEGTIDGFILIEKDEVAESRSAADRSYHRVSSKIEDWARKHNITLAPFKETRIRSSQRSVLDLVLETIPMHELQLVSMPLHMIKALNDRKL